MKFLQGAILIILSLLLVVESSASSSSNDVDVYTVVSSILITTGSSLSTSSNVTSRYWLSPSGNFSFGFYELPCTPSSSTNCSDPQYIVGLWSGQTLFWTPDLKNLLPLHKPSSILFTDQGKLVLRTMADNKETPLMPDIQEPVSYGLLDDNGNFVLYDSESQIVWESSDYPIPTDTILILGGRKLRPGGVGNRLSNQFIISAASSDLDDDGITFPQMNKKAQRVVIAISSVTGLCILLVIICCACFVCCIHPEWGCCRNRH